MAEGEKPRANMLKTYRKPRAPYRALVPALLALAGSACSDTRTSYETYVACDTQVAEAASVKDLLSCYTEDQHDLLRSKAERSDAWLAQFQGSRPIIKRLHEEQILNVEDE